MANQNETPEWPAAVYQVGVTDPVLGGAEGPVNIMGLALAKRALYQRLRNVTPWDAALAVAFGYPAGACVRHGATTWRAIVDNDVAPGSDAAKWERWGWSEKELAAYLRSSLLSPVACAVTGPAAAPSDASPYTMWKSVAPYGEYWMWMGDSWRVVAEHYGAFTQIAINTLGITTTTPAAAVTVGTFTAPRAGALIAALSCGASASSGSGGSEVWTLIQKNGPIVGEDRAVTNVSGIGLYANAATRLTVAAGDLISFRLTLGAVGLSGTVEFSYNYLS